MSKEIFVGQKGDIAVVDDEDYEKLSKYKWNIFRSSKHRPTYAIRRWDENGIRKSQYMHAMITGFDLTDHINHNGLDNRKSNLRFSTHSQNHANVPKQRGNYSSKYKGLTWIKTRNKWQVQIKVQGVRKYSGYFSDEIDAARMYDYLALKYFGEFAYTNFKEIK